MELLEWVEQNNKNSRNKLTDMKHFELFFVGGICLVSLIFAVIYVLLSKTVYFWDDSTYWDIGRMLAEKPLNFGFIKDIYTSIGSSDYNYFVAIPVALWMKIFAITRVSYIVSIVIFYLIPAEVLIYIIAKKLSKSPRFTFIITLMLIPALWYITVIGFIDVAGVMIGLLCYLLYMTDVLDKKPYLKSVLLGLFLVFAMITRRYFAFFSVSFITLMVVDSILIKHNYRQLAVTLLTVAFMLLTVFYPFFKNILLKDYGTLYSGYKYPLWTDLKLITRYFGTIFIIGISAAVIYTVMKHKKFKPAFAFLQIIVCAVMFVSTQTHGQQHLLLYIPSFVMIIIFAVNSIEKRKVLLVMCLIALINTVSPCINRTQPQNIQEIRFLSMFPSYSVKPKKRTDINGVLALKRTLDKKIPEGSKCGVLASSFVLNSSILTNVIPSLNMKETRKDTYIVGLPEVDSRDFWRLEEIYSCDYILVADPVQTHLAPSQQTIVKEAVESFKNNTDIARSFSRINDFNFKLGDVSVKLYKRSSDVSQTAKTEFQLRLYK